MKLRKNDRGNFELTEKFVLNFWRIFAGYVDFRGDFESFCVNFDFRRFLLDFLILI
jgi:hypothetical protein